MTKPKAVAFYSYLPPWRIDVFNEMGKYYDLTLVFLNANTSGFSYNRELLLSNLNVKAVFLNKGFNIGSKAFRVGIFKLLKAKKPEVVFSHEYSPTSIMLALFTKSKLINFKYIITTSDNLSMAEDVSGLKKIARSFVLNNADGIIVYSECVKKWYANNFKKLKIEICPNIQNPNTLLNYKKEFKPILANYRDKFQLNKPVILYVGRLEQVKGLDLLLEAFSKSLKDTHQLVLVGEGSQKEQLKTFASKMDIEQNVIFAGHFDGVELYAWYTLSHFFVLPSRYEPFGAVVNEALVYGCPVLASKYIGALDYIEDGVNGLVFDPLKAVEFKQTLLTAQKVFSQDSGDRINLMTYSFEQYVEVFKTIII